MPLLCSNPSDTSVHARDLPVAKSLPRPGSQPLCPYSSSAAHPEAPAGSGMCLLFPQPGTLFHASTASLPSFLQVLMCPPVISGVPWGVCLLFLPSFLPSSPFFHTLSLTLFLLFPSLIIPLTTLETYYVFHPFISFLSLFFHLEFVSSMRAESFVCLHL